MSAPGLAAGAGEPAGVAVVGGGILGLAVARELLRRDPATPVTVFEKEPRVASHQTGHNSGVVHAGLYYAPGSLKAQLCVRGVRLLRDFCRERDLGYEECGKLVVALDGEEVPRLHNIAERAKRNGVEGLRLLDARELRGVEPHATGLEALHSPRTSVVDFVEIAEAYAADVRERGGHVLTSAPVSRLTPVRGGVGVTVGGDTRRFARVVTCAGLQSDRIAALSGAGPDPRIIPFRGQYFHLRADARDLVRGLIYPVPDPRYPFLGVHLTRHIDGEVGVGPNALLALHREGYRLHQLSLRDTAATLAWPGFRRLAAQHWRTGARELRLTMSRRAFARDAARYVPVLRPEHLERGAAGIRAQAIGRDGALVDDFRIDGGNGIVHVRNAPSPAATASLAIAEYIADRL
jgi:(S)-2-hydroxyglutarate dehydrogenase